MPSKESIDRFYSKNTVRFSDDIQKQLAISQRDFITKSMPRNHASGGYRFIEFGAGNGWLVKTMSESSFVSSALGIEPDEKSVEEAKRRLKVKMETGFINQFQPNESGASNPALIGMSHVLEHLPDPIGTLKHLKEKFPQHLLFIEVPDGDEENEVMKSDVHFPTSLDQHLVGYNLKNLRLILEHEGYSIVSSEKLGKNNYWKVSKISNIIMRNHMEVAEEWKTNAKGPGVRTLLSYAKLFLMTCWLCACALHAKLTRINRLAYPSIRVLAHYQG